jgi:hypothetical protein
VFVDPVDDLVAVHQTDGRDVSNRKFGHLMWLVLNAAHVANPGEDPPPGGH